MPKTKDKRAGAKERPAPPLNIKKLPVSKWTPKTYEIECPGCEETIPHPNGSLFWTAEEISLIKIRICDACNLEFRLPEVK